MTTDHIGSVVADEIFKPAGTRTAIKANAYGEVETNQDGIEFDAIQGVVVPTLETVFQFRRVMSPESNKYVFNRLIDGSPRAIYLRINTAEDAAFNPFKDFELFELPPADIRYILNDQPYS